MLHWVSDTIQGERWDCSTQTEIEVCDELARKLKGRFALQERILLSGLWVMSVQENTQSRHRKAPQVPVFKADLQQFIVGQCSKRQSSYAGVREAHLVHHFEEFLLLGDA